MRRSILCLILSLLCLPACRRKPKIDPQKVKVDIEGQLLSGNLAEARKLAETFLDSRAREFKDAALFYAAFCQQYDPLQPQPLEAAQRYQSLLKEYPDSPLREETLFQLGQCFQSHPQLPNPRQALTWYQQLLAEFPNGSRTHRALLEKGLCHEALGGKNEAEQALVTYKQLANMENAEPWSQRALYRTAIVKERDLGDFSGAALDYQAFLDLEQLYTDPKRRLTVQMRLASLYADKLDRADDGRQIWAAILSETKEEDVRVLARQKMRGEGALP